VGWVLTTSKMIYSKEEVICDRQKQWKNFDHAALMHRRQPTGEDGRTSQRRRILYIPGADPRFTKWRVQIRCEAMRRRRGGWNAEDVKGDGNGRGVHLPVDYRGSGERHKFPSGVRGRAPTENEIWCILSLEESPCGDNRFGIFDTLWHIKIALIWNRALKGINQSFYLHLNF